MLAGVCISAPRKARRRLQLAASGEFSPLDLNLLAWYKGNNNALDSANGYDGTWVNTEAYTNGINLQALQTTSGYLTDLNALSAALGDYNALTIACWIRRDTVNDQDRMVNFTIVSTYAKILFRINIDNKLEIGARAESTDDFESKITTATLGIDTWYHVVAVVDIANDNIIFYINGDPTTSTGSPSWATTKFSADVGTRSTVGRSAGTIANQFEGAIDDLVFVGRVVTPAEVKQLYEWRE